mmetsp:Transcript_42455/g.51481  ORF Transcript_42455/g.51481 Transcript_42455/m.51481 type:complete len:252 (-) Transcript_42455:452-1207(-)|eukprot:CAMPEP_0197849828 /NCGR_PEP_ID=MMETSP1438-20131217/13341_1 /TAXON_ID=1461541 /ORGANISM="Pterosperma sp., Strain CCMP1384" /LENGTH=251 /DNA_ID=CAMNT_0043462683 /DNA_START=122 /DNA_END=877 /DNA_ORIENTATION=+
MAPREFFTRALLVLALIVGAESYAVQIAELQTECVKAEFTKDQLLPGENEDTVPTEVRAAFLVNKQSEPEQHSLLKLIVDVEIKEPDGKILLHKDDVHEEDLTFFAHGVGTYTMCFTNDGLRGNAPFKHSVPENKRIANVDIEFFEPIHMIDDPTEINIPHGSQPRRDKKLINSEAMQAAQAHINNLRQKLKLIQEEQKYIKKRERRHSETVISTNARTLSWAFFETCIFIGVNILQVIIMRASFNSKVGK